MKTKKKWFKSIIALTMALTLCFGLVPYGKLGGVFAAGDELLQSSDISEISTFWSNKDWSLEGIDWDAISLNIGAANAMAGKEKDLNFYSESGKSFPMKQIVPSLPAGKYVISTNVYGSGASVKFIVDGSVVGTANAMNGSDQVFSHGFEISENKTDFVVGIETTINAGGWGYIAEVSLKAASEEDGSDGSETSGPVETGSITTTDGYTFVVYADKTKVVKGESVVFTSKLYKDEAEITDLNTEGIQIWWWTKTGGASVSYSDYDDNSGHSLTATTTMESVGDVEIVATVGGKKIPNPTDATGDPWDALISTTIKVEAPSDEVALANTLKKLKDLVTECKALKEEYYRPSSWTKLATALTTAEPLTADGATVTLKQAQDAYKVLKVAQNDLKDASIAVQKIEGMSEDFIKGADISSFVSIRDSGATYKDWDGNVIPDAQFFKQLADAGLNYVRIRVWNDPYKDVDGTKMGYGGGNNDLEKAIKMGKLATDAGMQVLIDFHYSDFWADPERQLAPKAWEEMTIQEKTDALYAYTYDSLKKLLEAGVDVGMVQVGNETNNGMAGEEWDNMGVLFKAGCDAVHKAAADYDTEILAAVHFTDPQTPGNFDKFAARLEKANVDYDVFAASYYANIHGTMENITAVLKGVADKYNKKVMVAETSWPWTTKDGDGHGNTLSSGNYDYSFTPQGQANLLRDVMQAVVNIGDAGLGMFYWEPIWIPVQYAYDEDGNLISDIYKSNKEKWEKYGSGWASSYSDPYDAEHGGKWYGGAVMDNQALFDFNGVPLASLNVFKLVNTGSTAPYSKVDVVKNIEINAKSVEEALEKMAATETVDATYNDGSTKPIAVTWKEDDLAKVKGFGVYAITGDITYKDEYDKDVKTTTICTLAVLPDSILSQGDFEGGHDKWEEVNTEGVQLAWNDTPLRGEGTMHFWCADDMDFMIKQTVTVKDAGMYMASMQIQGGDGGKDENISVTILNETTQMFTTKDAKLSGWTVWQNPQADAIAVNAGDKVTVIVRIKDNGGAWGSVDDVFAWKSGELETHHWGNGTVKQAPACLEYGYEEVACTDEGCEAVCNHVLAPVGHKLKDYVAAKEPTAIENGNEAYAKCESCGLYVGVDADQKPIEGTETDNVKDFTLFTEVEMGETTIKDAADEVKDAVAAATGKETPSVNIPMGSDVEIPEEFVEFLKGKDVDVVFDMGGYTWTVNGQNIDKATKLSLKVNPDSKNIPADIVKATAGDRKTFQIHLPVSGEFGATLTLEIAVTDKTDAGKVATLYYYNKDKLEEMGTSTVDKDGKVKFDFTHASDYVIVIGAANTAPADDNKDKPADNEPAADKPAADKPAGTPPTGDDNPIVLWVVLFAVAAACVAAGVLFRRRARQE